MRATTRPPPSCTAPCIGEAPRTHTITANRGSEVSPDSLLISLKAGTLPLAGSADGTRGQESSLRQHDIPDFEQRNHQPSKAARCKACLCQVQAHYLENLYSPLLRTTVLCSQSRRFLEQIQSLHLTHAEGCLSMPVLGNAETAFCPSQDISSQTG